VQSADLQIGTTLDKRPSPIDADTSVRDDPPSPRPQIFVIRWTALLSLSDRGHGAAKSWVHPSRERPDYFCLQQLRGH
jgi:hypothetical protein